VSSLTTQANAAEPELGVPTIKTLCHPAWGFVAKVPLIPAVVSMNGSANKQKGRRGFLPLTGLKAVVEKGSGDQ
jgi:hypothetical protein